MWWRGEDLNLRPSGYGPDELPDSSTPRPTRQVSTRLQAGSPLRAQLAADPSAKRHAARHRGARGGGRGGARRRGRGAPRGLLELLDDAPERIDVRLVLTEVARL